MNGSDNSDNLEGVVTSDVVETEVVDTHGLFSGSQQDTSYGGQYPYESQTPYENQQNAGYGGQYPYGNPTPYENQQNAGYGGQYPYGNPTPYENQQNAGYGGQYPYGNPTPYENQQNAGYGGQYPYGSQPPYGNQSEAGYGGQYPYGNQTTYGNQQSVNYGGQPPYGKQPGAGYGGQPPYGNQPPYNNPYSPYAAPQKGQHTGLIVGIVVVIIILFLVAVFALASRAVDLFSEKEKQEQRRDVYDFDNAFDFDDDHDNKNRFHNDHDNDHDNDNDYDYDYDYDYDNDYDYDYDYDSDKYYTIHDDIKYNLSYQVDMEYYEYEPDFETDNFMLIADYPVISGDEVPNLDKLNTAVRKELDLVIDLFEKEYKKQMQEENDAYFIATLYGYVTYMDEDKMSVIYQEEIYHDMGSGMEGGVYLICVNVDMKNGVVLDNKDILRIDDAFSVDFRERSDEQNGEIDSLNYMTDQEITKYFNSDDVIVFYTPKGMEIGFNYYDGYGWVTVTYEEYEEYLKVF